MFRPHDAQLKANDQAMADKFDAKPMVLKELRQALPITEPAKRKRVTHQTPDQSSIPPKPLLTSVVTSSGRHSIAIRRESPDIGDSSTSKKKYEKRVKVACSTCGKSIARKAEDAGQETFSECPNFAKALRRLKSLLCAQSLCAGTVQLMRGKLAIWPVLRLLLHASPRK